MQERMRWISRWMVWLSLSLVLWTVAVESTHNHPSKTAAASCSICVVARSTSPTASSVHVKPVFASIGLLQEKEIIAKARLDASDLDIRGPPTV
jgi:hypothetical protein